MLSFRPPPRENIFEPSKEHDPATDYAGLVGGFPGTYPGHPTAPIYNGKYGVLAAGRESVAAADPFDATKLIEAAKVLIYFDFDLRPFKCQCNCPLEYIWHSLKLTKNI